MSEKIAFVHVVVVIDQNPGDLAVDAGRTLLLDREAMLEKANLCGIAMVGYEAEE